LGFHDFGARLMSPHNGTTSWQQIAAAARGVKAATLRACPAILTLAIAVTLAGVDSVRAATFLVDSTLDNHDSNPGDGLCVAHGPCTLRAAIEEANALGPGATHTIRFNIPGTGVKTIQVGATGFFGLPPLSVPITIDGYSQPGAQPNSNAFGQGSNAVLLIELDGTNALPSDGLGANGLEIASSGCTVRGLVINRYTGLNSVAIRGNGILIQGGTGNIIAGNFIGVDATGLARLANGGDGIYIINSASNVIGGSAPADRNVISGNTFTGVSMTDTAADGNRVLGNLIGTDASGTNPIPNGFFGAYMNGAGHNVIGGSALGAGNVISGNAGAGVRIRMTGAVGNVVQGNFIGTDASGNAILANQADGISIGDNASETQVGGTSARERNVVSGNRLVGIVLVDSSRNTIQGNVVGADPSGTRMLGNGGTGIRVEDGSNNKIGGAGSGAGNVVAFNGGVGVTVAVQNGNATGNTVSTNRIFANSLLGIDLGPDGVTQNDGGDDDGGPNNRQNFPVLTSAVVQNGVATVLGQLNSEVGQTLQIELFESAACDPSGFGEGQAFLGSVTTSTDADGNAAFTAVAEGAIAGRFVTATATDARGNTSEFSACLRSVAGASVTLSLTPARPVNSEPVTLAAAVSGATPSGIVVFRDQSKELGRVPVDQNGVATLKISPLTLGAHTLTADYSGDEINLAASSAPMAVEVANGNAGPPEAGCALGRSDGRFDPSLPVLLLFALVVRSWRFCREGSATRRRRDIAPKESSRWADTVAELRAHYVVPGTIASTSGLLRRPAKWTGHDGGKQ
jgi:CSLREA domain-containing protein